MRQPILNNYKSIKNVNIHYDLDAYEWFYIRIDGH